MCSRFGNSQELRHVFHTKQNSNPLPLENYENLKRPAVFGTSEHNPCYKLVNNPPILLNNAFSEYKLIFLPSKLKQGQH